MLLKYAELAGQKEPQFSLKQSTKLEEMFCLLISKNEMLCCY